MTEWKRISLGNLTSAIGLGSLEKAMSAVDSALDAAEVTATSSKKVAEIVDTIYKGQSAAQTLLRPYVSFLSTHRYQHLLK